MPLRESNAAHAFAQTFCAPGKLPSPTRQCSSGAHFTTSGLTPAALHDSPARAPLFLLLITNQLPYLASVNATYKIGDPVLVVGRICTVKTCIGLFGYVSDIYASGALALSLLSHPTLEAKNDIRAEKHGRFDTWHASAKPNDLRPLTDVKQLARVEALKAHEMAAPKRERDPRIEAVTAKYLSPEGIAKRKKDEADVAAETERIGQVFKLPGVIKRGDKSKFPAYRHPT